VSVLNPGAVRTAFFNELHFEPGSDPENAIEPEDVAEVILTILDARPGTVIDEINLSPQKQVWKKKN
jgi:NADP-dependent 3-hydroxy acid dehydrogenase YdfG